MTESEANEEAKAEAFDYDKQRAKAGEKNFQQRVRYNLMIEKVEQWENAPEGLKEFALSQLKTGRDFDCRDPFKFYGDRPSEDGNNWLQEQTKKATSNLQYHLEEQAKELSRVAERNAWLSQLRRSLK